jgi:serine protease Do
MAASAQGIGFAIPIDAVKNILPQLLEKGTVARGKLGIAVQRIDPSLAKALGLDRPRGALVATVEPGSAAQRAGIQAGEVIVDVDQTPITHANELSRLVAQHPPGARVALKVIGKGGAARTVNVTLDALRDDTASASKARRGQAPAPPAQSSGPATPFGIDVGDDGHGHAIVTRVDGRSDAADTLRPGDEILEVNGAPVKSAADAATRVRQSKTNRPLLLRVERNGQSAFVAIEPRSK